MKTRQIIAVHRASTTALLDTMATLLSEQGYAPVVDIDFVYGAGTVPLLLVAHVDTVHLTPPMAVYYDPKHQVLWSPDGLGADDRAGVAMIFALLQQGFKPHVLLLDGEETGCWGARQAVDALKPQNIHAIFELDRANSGDAVFYDCDNREFASWVKSFGWASDWGTFTDICTLCPGWEIAGVNLSVGYYHQHTIAEYLSLYEWRRSLKRIQRMLAAPPDKLFRYVAAKRKGWGWDKGRWQNRPGFMSAMAGWPTELETATRDNRVISLDDRRLRFTDIDDEMGPDQVLTTSMDAPCDLCGEEFHILYDFRGTLLCARCFARLANRRHYELEEAEAQEQQALAAIGEGYDDGDEPPKAS